MGGFDSTSEMGPQVLLKLSNIMQCSEVFPVSIQSRNDVRLVLILITTDYHQTIVCGGGEVKR